MSKELKKSRIVLSAEGQFSGLVEWSKNVYDADEVDALLAEKDKEIRRLRRALYKALANWAICKACILEYFCTILNAKKWERMYHKCQDKAEEDI